MRVIIAGSRTIKDPFIVEEAIRESGFNITTVVCGVAQGVDTLGAFWAQEQGILIHFMPARWDKYGRSAGMRRNIQMAENADALIAVWDGVSTGTKHMIDAAGKNGLPVYIKRVSE